MKPCDQFYTKSWVAEACFLFFQETMKQNGRDIETMFFIEPSAGEGSFFDKLPKDRRTGIDTFPKHKGIIKGDFLNWDYRPFFYRRQDTVVIGNPPFGKRGKLAVEFFNRAAKIADTVSFILPVSFRKYSIHKLLNLEFKWIASYDLPRYAFYTNKQDTYEINTEFQIWTRSSLEKEKNMRLFTPPPIKHSEFSLYQYNNTKEALSVFNKDFDFAVPSQGFQDYTRRETNPNKCEKNKQWVLFNSDNNQVIQQLWDMDYKKMAYRCGTIIPGFRKNDIIREYRIQYEIT